MEDGQSVDEILGSDCEKPIFMINPLVLRFILWFLSSSDFNFPQRDECYDKLTSFVAERIDSTVFDFSEIRDRYPAIEMLDPQLELSTLKFFHDALNKCKHVTTLHVELLGRGYLILDSSKGVAHILGLMNRDFFDRLTKIIIGDDTFKLKETDDHSLAISIEAHYDDALQIMNLLLQKCDLSQRNPQIYLGIETMNGLSTELIDVTPLLCRYVRHLYIGVDRFNPCPVKASAEFPHCPILTNLTIQGSQIDSSFSQTLRKAMQSGKLPRLRRVTMVGCRHQGSRSDRPDEVEATMTDEGEAKLLEVFTFDEKESSCCNCCLL